MSGHMHDPQPLRAILHRALARYLTVTPRGFRIAGHFDPIPRLVVRMLGYGGARTLYRLRKPVCRSLDGVVSVTEPTKRCEACADADSCTPQVRLDLVVDGKPHRLLLAFTSAKNFLAYAGKLREARIALVSIQHELVVVPRAAWGEVQFREAR
jgi:hypothetical protein